MHYIRSNQLNTPTLVGLGAIVALLSACQLGSDLEYPAGGKLSPEKLDPAAGRSLQHAIPDPAVQKKLDEEQDSALKIARYANLAKLPDVWPRLWKKLKPQLAKEYKTMPQSDNSRESNPLVILGLSKEDIEELKKLQGDAKGRFIDKQYKTLSKEKHPDMRRNDTTKTQEEIDEEFKLINDAKEVLQALHSLLSRDELIDCYVQKFENPEEISWDTEAFVSEADWRNVYLAFGESQIREKIAGGLLKTGPNELLKKGGKSFTESLRETIETPEILLFEQLRCDYYRWKKASAKEKTTLWDEMYKNFSQPHYLDLAPRFVEYVKLIDPNFEP